MCASSTRISEEKLYELPDLKDLASQTLTSIGTLLDGTLISSPIKRAQESFRNVANGACRDGFSELSELKRARHEIGYALRNYIDGNDERIKVPDGEKAAFELLRQGLNRVPDLAVD